MRVISGSAKGRRLLTPRGLAVRPTSDKVKEALFSILAGLFGPLEGCSVLDIYAGTGNLGIEALSRGADRAVFVDNSRDSASFIGKNLDLTGFRDRGRIIVKDFRSAIASLESEGQRFQLAFLDPPYRKGLTDETLELLSRSGLLDEGALVIAEHSSKDETGTEFGALRRCDDRVYGDTALAFFINTPKGSP